MQSRPPHVSRLVVALLFLAGWTAVGIVFALPNMAISGPSIALRNSLATWWAWAGLAPAIILTARRLPSQALGWRVAIHLLLALPFSLAQAYLSAFLAVSLGVAPFATFASAAPLAAAMHGGVLWSVLIYLVIAGASEALRYRDEAQSAELRIERLERGFSEARLHALRSQLDPHFLFNALNTVSALVASRPAAARDVIEQLGELLRYSLDDSQRTQVRLADELHFLQRYLAIQAARFGDRIKVEVQMDDEATTVWVPSLILQPLVENAIRHGLAPVVRGGTVRIAATLEDGALRLTVEDDGVGLPEGWSWNDAGVGLGVTRERLGVLYPGIVDAIRLRPRVGGGTSVELTLPCSEEPADAL